MPFSGCFIFRKPWSESKKFKTYHAKSPTKVISSDLRKSVETGTQATSLTTVRGTVTTKTIFEENGRQVEIIEVVEPTI